MERLRAGFCAIAEPIASEDQYRRYESDHQPLRRLAPGIWHSHACGSEVREALPNSGERLSSAQRIHHRAHLQQPIRVGEERSRRRRVRPQAREKTYQLSALNVVHDPTRRRFPIPVRLELMVVGADEYMEFFIFSTSL